MCSVGEAPVGVIDAIDFGLPVRRKPALLVANRFRSVSLPIGFDGPARTMASALGWGPGEHVNTRGAGASGGTSSPQTRRPGV